MTTLTTQPITVEIPSSTWTMVAALAAAVAAIAAAGGVIDQARRGRRTEGLDFVWRLLQAWDSRDSKLSRIKVASDLLKEPPEGSRLVIDLLNFFDVIGFFVRKGSISLEAAWAMFSSFVLPYRQALRGQIQAQQRDDPTLFSELEFLAEGFLKIDQKKRHASRARVEPSEKEIKVFLENEVELRFSLDLPEPPKEPTPTEPLPPSADP
jgi:hypothetical protein